MTLCKLKTKLSLVTFNKVKVKSVALTVLPLDSVVESHFMVVCLYKLCSGRLPLPEPSSAAGRPVQVLLLIITNELSSVIYNVRQHPF